MTERELIDGLRRLGRETLVDMLQDWHASNTGFSTGTSNTGEQTGESKSGSHAAQCPFCRGPFGASGDALYQLSRLHAEGLGHLMRAGASTLRQLAGLGLFWPGFPAGSGRASYGDACPPADQWPGASVRPKQGRSGSTGVPAAPHVDFYWAGRRDAAPPSFRFFVQNQDPKATRHVDVSPGTASMQSGYRPNVELRVGLEKTNLKPWEQTLVEVSFGVEHSAPGCVEVPFDVCLDGQRHATYRTKLLIEE